MLIANSPTPGTSLRRHHQHHSKAKRKAEITTRKSHHSCRRYVSDQSCSFYLCQQRCFTRHHTAAWQRKGFSIRSSVLFAIHLQPRFAFSHPLDMPPATRREVRLSASLPDPCSHNAGARTIDSNRSSTMLIPNMDAILENFEQFKRKHISQNREIIKTNAVHQLRIRELENRIQALEAEKIQKEIDTVGLTGQLAQLRHAIGAIHAGWEAIGRGLTLSAGHALSSIDDDHPDHAAPHLPASNRVVIEPNPNASAVVRSIARAPDGHLESLQEEHPSLQDHKQPIAPHLTSCTSPKLDAATTDLHHDNWHKQLDIIRAAHTAHTGHAANPHSHISSTASHAQINMEGAPSPMRSPELPIELQDVIAAASFRPSSHTWLPPHVSPSSPVSTASVTIHSIPDHHDPSHDSARQLLRRSGRRSSRRKSGYFSQNDLVEPDAQSPDSGSSQPPAPPSSDPYLPSETNSETMEGLLVYRGSDQAPVIRTSLHRRPATPLLDITNSALSSPTSPQDLDAIMLQDTTRPAEVTPRKTRQSPPSIIQPPHVDRPGPSKSPRHSEPRTPGGRKRKIPNHEPQDAMPTPARLFSAAIDATASASASASTPSFSVTDHEAEPQTGRTRRVRKSINYALPKLNTKMRKPDPSDLVPASTPHRSNTTKPTSACGMVGSTGNLSDIRRLHEAAALRQSPADRTSTMRSREGPVHANRIVSPGDDDASVRMADLFEIRQHTDQRVAHTTTSDPTSDTAHAFWNTSADAITDTSDDDSRVTSNADLGELAELEAAMGDLCTADEGPQQVDTPRAPQPSMWPSRSSTQVSASSSTDSTLSRASSTVSNPTASKRPSLRRKTTTLPSRSRQSSAEQAIQAESVDGSDGKCSSSSYSASVGATQVSIVKIEPTANTGSNHVVAADPKKVAGATALAAGPKKDAERMRAGSAASTSTESGNGRPSLSSTGLAAGMRPKQRPASADAAPTARPASASLASSGSVDRPRTFSGTTATKAGLTQTSASNTSTGSVGPSSASTSAQRASLHSALTNPIKATSGQMTPRIGAKGLSASTTPSAKESPRLAGTPVLRPTPSTSSLASESSGRSSPALSAASVSSSGTQLTTSTRMSLKPAASSNASQAARSQRPGTAGSYTSGSVSMREDATSRLNGSACSTGAKNSVVRPQPVRSMPSLRRATDKTAVTSTPRITVRSSSSTVAVAAPTASANGNTTSMTPATSIAASKVAKAISSNPTSRSKDINMAPMGLGIDFTEASSGHELLSLTDEIHQVLQNSGSSVPPSSSLSSEPQSSSPTSKASSDDTSLSHSSLAKARRTSRRVSGMTA